MMDKIRAYLFSFVAAALLCALVRALVPKGRLQKICTLLCGIFLAITALSGPAGWELTDFTEQLWRVQIAAEEAKTGVEIRNREALAAIIKRKTEAYILDKAEELGLTVSVEVSVADDGSYPYPRAVSLRGSIPAAKRQALSRYIEEDLAIGEENQQWISE